MRAGVELVLAASACSMQQGMTNHPLLSASGADVPGFGIEWFRQPTVATLRTS
jgi:hypothetical protein